MEENCDMSLEFERRLAGDQKRIEEALEEILAAHGEMELYFPGWFGEFPRACAAAAP